MTELLEHLPVEIGNLIAVGTIDTDVHEYWELCRSHKLPGIPFLEFYRDGELVRSFVGIEPADKLHNSLKELIQGPAN